MNNNIDRDSNNNNQLSEYWCHICGLYHTDLEQDCRNKKSATAINTNDICNFIQELFITTMAFASEKSFNVRWGEVESNRYFLSLSAGDFLHVYLHPIFTNPVEVLVVD